MNLFNTARDYIKEKLGLNLENGDSNINNSQVTCASRDLGDWVVVETEPKNSTSKTVGHKKKIPQKDDHEKSTPISALQHSKNVLFKAGVRTMQLYSRFRQPPPRTMETHESQSQSDFESDEDEDRDCLLIIPGESHSGDRVDRFDAIGQIGSWAEVYDWLYKINLNDMEDDENLDESTGDLDVEEGCGSVESDAIEKDDNVHVKPEKLDKEKRRPSETVWGHDNIKSREKDGSGTRPQPRGD
ncbi:hypothetical protein B0T19DRAFT_438211 [Cercophora scortea]|uniref:Uncharacterized protein n=1 Tax=Cercophora scortea TaxID=314031 RepID=A0AAE0MM06_9PEZI|nr:hypothetical protein B0T19DRAFT_438211 [Cercophora scortea]